MPIAGGWVGVISVVLTLALCSSSSAPLVVSYPPSLALVALVPSGRRGWEGQAGGWRRKGMRCAREQVMQRW